MTRAEQKHQAAAQWREKTAECRSSGMHVNQRCGIKGNSWSTYYRREEELFGKLQKERCEALVNQPSFVPVPVDPPVNELPAVTASVRIGSASVDICSGADTWIVEALCRRLMKC